MLGIRLEPALERRLKKLARKTGRSKSYYAREAIRQYLDRPVIIADCLPIVSQLRMHQSAAEAGIEMAGVEFGGFVQSMDRQLIRN